MPSSHPSLGLSVFFLSFFAQHWARDWLALKKERKKTDKPREGWEERHAATKKERKKTDNPREGWENGTPPPHRDFKERGVVR